MKKLIALGLAVPMAFLMACSSDDHSVSAPDDDATVSSSSEFTEEDLDKLLAGSSSSEKTSGDKSSSSVKTSEDKSSSSVKESSADSKSSSSEKTSEDKSSSSVTAAKSCDDVLDETGKMALDLVNDKSAKLFETFADKDMDAARALAAEVKPMYKKILDKYPEACGAQVGYAFATIGDLGNSKELRLIWDDYYNDSFRKGVSDVSEFVDIVTRLSGEKSFTQRVQDALTAEVLPAVDSSIKLLQNVVAHKDYALRINDGETVREMDMSEFGLALGGLFAVKAAVAIATSMNLEVSYEGGYSWMNHVEDLRLNDEPLSRSQTKSVKAIVSLIGAKGTFTTIIKGKEDLWKSVPDLIDSAITEARASFLYSLDEVDKKGSQEFDIYVVGDGYDADISEDDVEEIIDALETALEVTRGPYEVKIQGEKLVFDARKYFENTKGIEAFLPYYEFTDESDFSTFHFTDADGNKTADLLDFVDSGRDFIKDAEGKVVFRDPTFGGVFPEFTTQQKLWDFLKAIDD